MSTNPKDVASRYYAIVDGGDPEQLRSICSPDLKGHAGAGHDLTELVASVGSFVSAFPDMTTTVQYLVAEGDLVSSWVTYQGTHQGVFAGVAGTDRQMRIYGWDVFRVRDGRIVELTSSCDVFTLLNQIGALPTTAAV